MSAAAAAGTAGEARACTATGGAAATGRGARRCGGRQRTSGRPRLRAAAPAGTARAAAAACGRARPPGSWPRLRPPLCAPAVASVRPTQPCPRFSRGSCGVCGESAHHLASPGIACPARSRKCAALAPSSLGPYNPLCRPVQHEMRGWKRQVRPSTGMPAMADRRPGLVPAALCSLLLQGMHKEAWAGGPGVQASVRLASWSIFVPGSPCPPHLRLARTLQQLRLVGLFKKTVVLLQQRRACRGREAACALTWRRAPR